MRSALAHAAQKRAERRQRASSLSVVPPAESSDDYSPELASLAASILYRSPKPSQSGRPVYILNAAAFPDAYDADYDSLLSYVLARLPGEDDLLSGTEYEIIFFAGGQPDNATSEKKQGAGMGWYLQAYHVLSRATRKRLQRLYIVHPRTWVRVLIGVFGTIVSPKFRRKIVHVNNLSALALQVPLEKLLIPPPVYLHDRKLSPDIYVPFVTGKRAFGVRHPLPKDINTGETRLPRVLRETTSFLVMPANICKEGLFRIPAHATLAGVLKEAYDRGQDFIVWKEPGATAVQPDIDQSLVDEIRLEDAYGVHLAASLIKQWYRDLRDPIFPESSYGWIMEKCGSDKPIKPEHVVEILLPASDVSPLTNTARQILNRHLLPLLSEVAAHESENKMNAENLAILFSMCLVCGSDQLQDAKVASIIRRILLAAVEMWPQLRDGMGIPAHAFHTDLASPIDPRDYEDPLEESLPPPQTASHQKEPDFEPSPESEGHHITLEDSESSPVKNLASKPQIRVFDRSVPDRAPTLPPRPVLPAISPSFALSAGSAGESAYPFPKRKPAPPISEPPRYSSVFDTDGNSIHVADSPASYAPADGFGPPKHSLWSFDEYDTKKPFETSHGPSAGAPSVPDMPKRKAVSAEYKTDFLAAAHSSDLVSTRSASEGSALANMAAQKAVAMMRQSDSEPPSLSHTTNTSPQESVLAEGDGLFRKPMWPASARPQSLAKPVQPIQAVPNLPVPLNGYHQKPASGVPRTRAPSPGLLRRISSMECAPQIELPPRPASAGPKKLDLRRPSVDDLKRLYEERLSTAMGLAKADASRRASTSN